MQANVFDLRLFEPSRFIKQPWRKSDFSEVMENPRDVDGPHRIRLRSELRGEGCRPQRNPPGMRMRFRVATVDYRGQRRQDAFGQIPKSPLEMLNWLIGRASAGR